jgi:hypothetical protein
MHLSVLLLSALIGGMTPISIPWIESESDFNAIADSFTVHESGAPMAFAEWIAQIEDGEKQIASMGYMPVRVTIKPAALKEWGKTSGIPLGRKAVTSYAMWKLTSDISDKGSN